MAIFEKGSLGDIAVYEALLCMFPEETKKKESFPSTPPRLPHSFRRIEIVLSFLYPPCHVRLILPLTKMAPRWLLAQLIR